jgi:hypothetical protein
VPCCAVLCCAVGDGMTWHPLAKESAHYGPVRTIAAAAGRVWTCGGSSAFAVLKEWTPDGILVDTHSMRSMGERRWWWQQWPRGIGC